MGYPHIALMGRARSGKDTVAARLVQTLSYTRLAFADPLKELALKVDPISEAEFYGSFRLSELIQQLGWETAKEETPEVRRILQHLGQGIRDLDPDFWLRQVLAKVEVADRWNLPVVVSDCRYPNEAEALSAAGFTLVRITRSGGAESVNAAELEYRQHKSETALDGHAFDVELINDGSIAALHKQVDALTA